MPRLGITEWEAKEEEGSKARQIHLHCVGFSCPRLPVGEDADVVAVDAGGDQGLNLLKHLGGGVDRGASGEGGCIPPSCSSVDGRTHLLLGCLWGEDLIQLEGHLLPLVQEVQDGIIIGVEGQRVGRLRALAILLCDGADSPKNTDVSLGVGGGRGGCRDRVSPGTSCCHPRSPSNARWAECCSLLLTKASHHQPKHLMGMRSTQVMVLGCSRVMLPCPSCPPPGTYSPVMGPATLLTHLSAAPARCDTSCVAAAPAGTCAAAPGWCCAPPRWPGRSGGTDGEQWFNDLHSIPTPHSRELG